jgi:hypothetical protein
VVENILEIKNKACYFVKKTKKLPNKFEVVSRVKGSKEFSSVITYNRSRYEIKSHLANS